LILALGLVAPALAEIHTNLAKTIDLPAAAKDVALAEGGKKIFVLLPNGQVQILSPAGKLLNSFEVAKDAESLTVSPKGNRVFVTAGGGGEIQLVDVTYTFNLPVGTSPAKGPADAPITIIEFSDFQCPYCAKSGPLLEKVMAAYPGKVRLVFKQFPLRMHKFAEKAAIASLAARNQDKFWPMHDKLFENFRALNDAKIKQIAAEVGLDIARFEKDIANPALRQEMIADMQLGQKSGVRGTPTVFLNGQLVQQRSLAGFKAMIEKELKKK
jgi:protein-disulfide isomerase